MSRSRCGFRTPTGIISFPVEQRIEKPALPEPVDDDRTLSILGDPEAAPDETPIRRKWLGMED